MLIALNFDETMQEAHDRAVTMVENGLYDRFEEDYNTRVEHAKIGCIGEIAFEKLVNQYHMNYRVDRDNYEDRNADEFDFEINGVKIDVKVAKTDYKPADGWTYGYPQQQIGMEKEIVVVGWVSERYRRVGFYGWMFFDRIQDYPLVEVNTFRGYRYKTPNYEFPWGDLNKDFNALFEYLRNNNNGQ